MKLYISFPFVFSSREHEEFFADVLHETGTAYPPNIAAIYLLSATAETRDRFWSMVDLDGNFVDENTLSVNIRRLREKIEDDPSSPSILKNVRGLGYIWERNCEKR